MVGWTWVLIGCGGGEVQPPTLLDPAPTSVSPGAVDELRGRWVSARRQADAGWVACESGPTLEIRGDGRGGWELVGSRDGELRLAPLVGVSSEGPHTALKLEGEPALLLEWEAPARVATFRGWYGEQPFLSPSARKIVPTAPCE